MTFSDFRTLIGLLIVRVKGSIPKTWLPSYLFHFDLSESKCNLEGNLPKHNKLPSVPLLRTLVRTKQIQSLCPRGLWRNLPLFKKNRRCRTSSVIKSLTFVLLPGVCFYWTLRHVRFKTACQRGFRRPGLPPSHFVDTIFPLTGLDNPCYKEMFFRVTPIFDH